MPSLRLGDEAVRAKTGKAWHEWFEILSRVSTHDTGHQEIVTLLNAKYGLSAWWSQMVANAYEQHAGIRERYQRSRGYEISVSKTFPVAVTALYDSWSSDKSRSRWLKGFVFQVTASVRNRSIRAQWQNRESSLSVDFYSKGVNKSQVVVQHMRLNSPEEAERIQLLWKSVLEDLNTQFKKEAGKQ
jgi:hypothetical protein